MELGCKILAMRCSILAVAMWSALSLAATGAGAAPIAAEGPQLAYVDPGTGSFLVQVLIATLAGASVAVHRYWNHVKGWFQRGKATGDDDSPSDEQ